MFERFTDAARQVMVKAQEEARALGHDRIGTEHLLFGLAFEQDQIADRVLRSAGVTPERVRERVVMVVERGDEPGPRQNGFTPRAQQVVAFGSVRRSASCGGAPRAAAPTPGSRIPPDHDPHG
jgi:ATP-dependent Clp protease ATP-binding subunit ClpC